MTDTNRRFVLAERPIGAPDENTLRLETVDVPQAGAGEMLLRTEFLSLDPYMRGRMSDAPSYAAPVEIDAVMGGATVAKVVTSNLEKFEPGDWVLSMSGWQDYAVSDGTEVMNLGKSPVNPSWALGILGMPGFTGYAGLLEIGAPKAGETVCVAAATGPVGSTVGQIAKIKGCRAVGIAGGPEKCAHAVEKLGFDACLDHKAADFSEQLKAACPDGIDIYYENVGGKIFEAVMPLLNDRSRIPVCGVIAQYNMTSLPEGPNMLPLFMNSILRKRIKMQGFIIWDTFPHIYPAFAKDMNTWIAEGKIHYREHVYEGLESAPGAFSDLLEGRNFGKVVIRVGDSPV